MERSFSPEKAVSRLMMLVANMRQSQRLKLRAAIAGYVLRKWSVDCSPDHRLQGPEYRLWLKDHLSLYGVETAAFAPGYLSDKALAA